METTVPSLTGRYAILDGTVTVIGARTRPMEDVYYQTAIGPVHTSVIHTTYATRQEAERTLAARALRAVPSDARTAQSRANGARGGRPVLLGTIETPVGRAKVRYAPGAGRVECVLPDGTVEVPEEASVASLDEARATAAVWYGRDRTWGWTPA